LKGRRAGAAVVVEFLGQSGLRFEEFREGLESISGLSPSNAAVLADAFGSEEAMVEDIWRGLRVSSLDEDSEDYQKQLEAAVDRIRNWEHTTKPLSPLVAGRLAKRFVPTSLPE